MRPFVPALLIAIVMSAIYAMPPFKDVPSAMSMDVGTSIGPWKSRIYPTPEAVLRILADDTDFTNAECSLTRLEEMSFITGEAPTDFVNLTIVLSGHDLANSIHRPERCLVGQGHRALTVSSGHLALPSREPASDPQLSATPPVPGAEPAKSIPITRILSKQDIGYGPKDDRKIFTRDCMTYYFFVGQDRITANHTERTLIDIKDRVFKGESQRWAFIMATMPYLADEEHQFGGPPDFEIADKKIRQLLANLADENIDWEKINR